MSSQGRVENFGDICVVNWHLLGSVRPTCHMDQDAYAQPLSEYSMGVGVTYTLIQVVVSCLIDVIRVGLRM